MLFFNVNYVNSAEGPFFLLNRISKEIVAGNIAPGVPLRIDAADNRLIFCFTTANAYEKLNKYPCLVVFL